MRYISVFSGIEAASVAWEQLGWEPVAFSEIDAFPSAVLAARFPNVPNLGDITKVDWSPYRGTVDVVVGGSPCQSFSVAGKREGLAGASGLMWEYIRCVQEVMPSWFVWENVPGCLTVERGRAFAQLLDSLDELGYGLAWRILDAQFVRVPGRGGWIGPVAQRRRRVFLVGHLGDMRACEVLFEPESLRWDNPSSREKRKALARAAGRGTASGGGEGGCLTPWENHARRVYDQEGIAPSLLSRKGSGQNQQSVLQSIAFKVRCGGGEYVKWDGSRGTAGRGALCDGQTAYTVAATQDQYICVQEPIVMASGQANAEVELGGGVTDADAPSRTTDMREED